MAKRLQKVSIVLIIGLVIVLMSVGAYAEIPGPEKANVNWKQASGQTINVMMCSHHFTDALRTMLPEFESLTGIKVKMQDYTEGEYFKKIMIDLSSGKPVSDVFMMNASYTATYAEGKWVEPILKHINDSKLTDSKWYNFADYPQGSLKLIKYKGTLYGIPLTVEPQLLFYRKDLLKEKGIGVPQTMDELYATAKKLHSDKVAGIALRLLRGQGSWWPWSGFLATYRGEWVDENRVPHLNSPQTVAATDMYIKLIKNAGPAGVMNYGWYEVLTDFQQGKAAMILDANSFISQFENPQKSAVVGKVGAAVIPAAPDGYRQPAGGTSWSIAMSAKSRHKTAAWLFIQWATSPKVATEIAIRSGNVARGSIWENKDFLAKFPYPDWIKASADSNIKYSDTYSYPQVKEFAQLVDIVDITLQGIYSGTPAKKALDDAQAKTEEVLKGR